MIGKLLEGFESLGGIGAVLGGQGIERGDLIRQVSIFGPECLALLTQGLFQVVGGLGLGLDLSQLRLHGGQGGDIFSIFLLLLSQTALRGAQTGLYAGDLLLQGSLVEQRGRHHGAA